MTLDILDGNNAKLSLSLRELRVLYEALSVVEDRQVELTTASLKGVGFPYTAFDTKALLRSFALTLQGVAVMIDLRPRNPQLPQETQEVTN